jgi:TPR repeat protein
MRAALCTLFLLSCGSPRPGSGPGPGPAPRQAAAPSAPRSCAPAECERACEAGGDAKACTRIAELYWEGQNGHPHDPARAFRFATRACDAGDGFGCSLLGLCYQDGIGTEWAPARAVAAYEKACKAGAGVGCYNLSGMYSGAHGVDADPEKADALMKLAESHWRTACEGAEPRWCTNAAFLLRRRGGPGAYAGAYALDRRACDHGVGVGCVEALGDAHTLGRLDLDAYSRELEKLCIDGEPSACSNFGPFIEHVRSGELLRRGCELGDRASCELLGVMYELGKDVPKDDEAKRRYYRMACDRAVPSACQGLARDALTTGSPEVPDLLRRGCQMGDATSCDLLAEVSSWSGDTAAIVRWATEGCRMASRDSCKRLIERDAELPVIPADVKRELYTDACRAQIATACRRLEPLK